MTTTWISDGTGVQPGDDGIGGDTQRTDSYRVGFWRKEDGDEGRLVDGERLFSVVTMNFYGETTLKDFYDEDGLAKDSEGQPILWMTIQTEFLVCNDRDDPGGTERDSSTPTDYDETNHFFSSVDLAQAFCEKFAEGYDEGLANRDIVWSGLAHWEPV